MNCEVHGVYKNLRYRILVIGDQTYILDLGRSFWKILFPFFYWMFPNSVFEVKDQNIIEKIKTPEIQQQSNTGGLGWLGGGAAIVIANLMKPLTDYFDIQSSPLVNSIIVFIAIILMISFRFYVNHLNKKSLYHVVKLDRLPKGRLWIRPKPIKHFFLVVGIYLLFLAFAVVGFGVSIESPNVIILFITTLFLFLALFASAIAVMVDNTMVKFKSDKKTVA